MSLEWTRTVIQGMAVRDAKDQAAVATLRSILADHPGPWSSSELQGKILASGHHSRYAARAAMLTLRANRELVPAPGYKVIANVDRGDILNDSRQL